MMRFSALWIAAGVLAAAQAMHFATHTIASDLKGGYQVVACDVNHDGKIDLIALASGMTDLVWFENPGWVRHTIASNLPHMINLAARDIDGDGIPEIVIAYEFSNEASKSVGVVAVLHHDGDPTKPWKLREIDRQPTSHRLRWADIDGSGHPVVISAPLTGPHTGSPDFREHVPLLYYRPGDWKRFVIGEQNEGVQHGITIVDWNHDGRDAILTSSFVGLHLFELGREGKWTRTEISKGDPSPWPKSGSSDSAVGTVGKERFIAAIEPWHGNQVVVYRQRGGAWQREVIDDSLADGHTILALDLDGDGNDEIVAGFRGSPQRVYIYKYDGAHWIRQTLDEGIAAASCAIADLNGDGKPDIACIGSATQNLRWYENVGAPGR